MNDFLKDKDFGEKIEALVAKELGLIHNKTDCDDHGIDVMDKTGKFKADVKAHQKPRVVSKFEGVYLETYQKNSKKPGWLFDDKKQNNFYIFAIDCESDGSGYERLYIVNRELLQQVVKTFEELGKVKVKEGPYEWSIDLKKVEYKTTTGYIFPYLILEVLDVRNRHKVEIKKGIA